MSFGIFLNRVWVIKWNMGQKVRPDSDVRSFINCIRFIAEIACLVLTRFESGLCEVLEASKDRASSLKTQLRLIDFIYKANPVDF